MPWVHPIREKALKTQNRGISMIGAFFQHFSIVKDFFTVRLSIKNNNLENNLKNRRLFSPLIRRHPAAAPNRGTSHPCCTGKRMPGEEKDRATKSGRTRTKETKTEQRKRLKKTG